MPARGQKVSSGNGLAQDRLTRPRPGMEPVVMTSLDSFKCCRTLKVGSKTYAYYSLPVA